MFGLQAEDRESGGESRGAKGPAACVVWRKEERNSAAKSAVQYPERKSSLVCH